MGYSLVIISEIQYRLSRPRCLGCEVLGTHSLREMGSGSIHARASVYMYEYSVCVHTYMHIYILG